MCKSDRYTVYLNFKSLYHIYIFLKSYLPFNVHILIPKAYQCVLFPRQTSLLEATVTIFHSRHKTNPFSGFVFVASNYYYSPISSTCAILVPKYTILIFKKSSKNIEIKIKFILELNFVRMVKELICSIWL